MFVSNTTVSPVTTTRDALPDELLAEIVALVSWNHGRPAVADLSCANKRLRSICSRTLFAALRLNETSHALQKIIPLMRASPSVLPHVRTVFLRVRQPHPQIHSLLTRARNLIDRINGRRALGRSFLALLGALPALEQLSVHLPDPVFHVGDALPPLRALSITLESVWILGYCSTVREVRVHGRPHPMAAAAQQRGPQSRTQMVISGLRTVDGLRSLRLEARWVVSLTQGARWGH